MIDNIRKYHMTDNKQTVQFDIEYFQGVTCIGCAMIVDLAIEVEFTNDEIAQMRQLISQLDEPLYGDGLMPVLKDAAPELHKRIDSAARSAIFDFLVEDGINQGYIEFDDDELRRNFLNDNDLTEEDFDENLYDKWYDEEMSRINCSGLDRIRSRYSIDNQVTLEDNPDYTCDIPVDFLP